VALDRQPVNLRSLGGDVVGAVRPRAAAHDVSIIIQGDSAIGTAMGDPERRRRLVLHLSANTLKFTPRRGRVEVALNRIGDHARLTVTDTGQGFRREFLPCVCEPWRQAQPAGAI
jgi:signal transduction histidine kinase